MDKINNLNGVIASKITNNLNKQQENNQYNEKLQKAAQEFDALIIQNLLDQAINNEGDKLFGQSYGNEIYNSMMNKELASLFANNKEFGFNKLIIEQYSKK